MQSCVHAALRCATPAKVREIQEGCVAAAAAAGELNVWCVVETGLGTWHVHKSPTMVDEVM